MDRVKLKGRARKAIEGKIINLFVVVFVATVVVGLLSSFTFGLAGILLMGGVMLSTAAIYLAIVNKNKTPEIADMMYGFKSGIFVNGLMGYLRYSIFTALWSLLLVIPGIVKMLEYSMMFYIMVEDPKMDAGAAQRKSMKMMEGHRMDLFVLQLSFFPWYLLVGVTFGLATVYVAPYVNATMAEFYEELKKSTEKKTEKVAEKKTTPKTKKAKSTS